MNKRLPEYKKVFTREIFSEYKKEFSPNYILMIITAVLYVAILYRYGISNNFIENLDLIKYLILTPMLLSVVVIDYKLQIIPNRLNLTMFEIGLIFAFLYGFSNVAISINMLLGMLAGGGIFLVITLLGGLVYGKEAMGLGDVKLMGALGLYFGLTNIIISVDEYIPFGPFIVVGAFISIFVPSASLIAILMNIFTLGLYSKNN